LGVCGSNGAVTGSIKSKMAADGYLGMTALSRVTFASAGLSCTTTDLRNVAPCIVVSTLASINVVNRYRVRLLLGWVTGKPSGCVTSYLGRLSLLPSVGW